MNEPVRFPRLPSERLAPPPLGDDELHLWSCRLDLPPQRVEQLSRPLSLQERQRAGRFRFDRHRSRYTVSWGLTRVLLALYADAAPRAIELGYGPKGRPHLIAPDTDLEFNLSHTGDQYLLAVRRGYPVGVDVERLRRLDAAASIARRLFSSHEIDQLESLPAETYLEGFFNCWTRKEALVKTRGEGVFDALDRFDVSLAPGEPVRLLAVDGSAEHAQEWSLYHLEPAPRIVGAVATNGPPPSRVRAWTLEPHRQTLPGID